MGESIVTKKLFERAARIALESTRHHLLLEGPEGSGRRSLAAEIHARSSREGSPYVELSCRDCPVTLMESRLFGHERGSFTGVVERRPGAFGETRPDGTLVLAEVHSIPLEVQPKVLRALREQRTRAVGSNAWVPWNGRVIATTHRDLRSLADRGLFHPELFQVLTAGGHLHLSALADASRREDIGCLLAHFLDDSSASEVLPPKTVARLEKLSWPGNVTQLRAVATMICDAVSSANRLSDLVTELELLDAVAQAPHDDGPREVYGDLLTARHDPRGELIGVQRRLAHGVDDEVLEKTLRKTERKLLKTHGATWNADLLKAIISNPSSLRSPLTDEERKLPIIGLRCGFADSIRAPLDVLRRLELVFAAAPTVTALEIVTEGYELMMQLGDGDLASPFLSRLRRLVVVLGDGADASAIALANATELRNLHELIVWGAGSSEGNAVFIKTQRYGDVQGKPISEVGIEALLKSPHLANLRLLMVNGRVLRE